MKKLCIFDLDGTVLDTLETIAYYGNYALKLNGIEPIKSNKYKYLAGDGVYNLIKNMLNERNSYSESMFDKVLKDYSINYEKDTSFKSKVFDGMKETLDKIKARGVKIAIVSNKPDPVTKSVVGSIFGKDYFDLVIGQRDNIPIKPDPYSVSEALDFFNINKDECIYIGDTSTDMKTGKNSGIFTVGVLWGFRDEEELINNGADIIIKEPYELYELIN